MEFGIFVQGHVPRRKTAEDSGYEHTSFLNDVVLVKQADRFGFKYAWLSEHHFLEEYSHLSASEVFLGYLAGVTERIHLGSAIWNISPPVNHPVRVAERVTMMDHLSDGRARILLRYSGTEPLARVMVEGDDQMVIEDAAHDIAAAIRGEIGSPA